MMSMKCLLNRVHLAAVSHTLDGLEGRGVGLHRERQAGARGFAIDDHRATAALAGAAADVSAGEAEVFAQEIAEKPARRDCGLPRFTVDDDGYGKLLFGCNGHVEPLPRPAGYFLRRGQPRGSSPPAALRWHRPHVAIREQR